MLGACARGTRVRRDGKHARWICLRVCCVGRGCRAFASQLRWLADVWLGWLHETAMAWVRERLEKTVPKVAWEETVKEYGARLEAVAIYIAREYGVAALCRALPRRVAQLNERNGDRIPKQCA